MKPEDILLLPLLGRPTLSGDGRFVAFPVSLPDLGTDSNLSQLWGGRTDADASVRLTDGNADSSPVVSPDGRSVGFLRPGEGGRPQVHLLSIDSGDVVCLTQEEYGVADLVWSPDSTRLAYTAHRVVDAARAERATVRVTDLVFYSGVVGYTAGLARCVCVLDVADGSTVQLTWDDGDDTDLDWSPRGDLISFVSAKHDQRRNRPRTDIWTVTVADGKVEARTDGGMSVFRPRFSPDGEVVYFSGSQLVESGFNDGYASFGVWAIDVWSRSSPRRVSHDRYNLSYVCQTLVPHGDRVYIGSDDHGRVPLVGFHGADMLGEGEALLEGDFQVNGFDVAGDPNRPVVACVVADPGSAGDLWIVDGAGVRVLTSFGDRLRASVPLRAPTRIATRADDGHPLEGWVFEPDGDGPHPVVLVIKGGPYTQFGYTMSGPASFEDAQVLSAAGYLVVIGNPRGSSGYGQEHVAGVREDLPSVTSADLRALLHRALADFPTRADRVGVMGGSFGGYMAAWLVATTDLFSGAIGERGCYALDSYLASSDDGVNIVHALWGPDRDAWRAHSPLTHVDTIEAPVLLLHSDQDRHAPIEQARRLFTEMRVRGKRAEMVIFPGGGHELSRSGPIRQRLARFDAILSWWQELLRD